MRDLIRDSLSEIESAGQQAGHPFGAQAEKSWYVVRDGDYQRGFTLVELVMVIVIVGILAVFVAPRFFDANLFKARGFADQVQSTLRYAQKEAIAQRRNVCVALSASTITMTIGSSFGSACNATLLFPTGVSSITAPAGTTLSPAVTVNFAPLGSTPSAQIITVSGATNNIVVEAQTGYVHSP